MVAGYQYTVIGVLAKKKQNGSYGSGPDNTQLFTTYSAMARDFPPTRAPRNRARFRQQHRHRTGLAGSARKKPSPQVKRIIAERHHYDPNDKEALWIWDTLEGSKFTERIFSVMTLFFGAVALLTLALGGNRRHEHHVGCRHRTHARNRRPQSTRCNCRGHQTPVPVESAIITLVSGIARLALASAYVCC